MSKLEPQVGDKVTLTHEQGFVVKGRLIDRAFTGGWERWTIQNVGKFHDDEGWSVTAVERPDPEPGTFVKGTYDALGGVKEFAGVYVNGVFNVVSPSGSLQILKQVLSWEVIS